MPPGATRVAATRGAAAGDDDGAAADDCAGWPAYGTCDGGAGLQAIAFARADGRLAVVVLNCGDDAQPLELERAASGDVVANTVPAHSIQTYLF